MTDRPYLDHSQSELFELRRLIEKLQQQKIRQKHNTVYRDSREYERDEDYQGLVSHILQLSETLMQINQELDYRREERRIKRERQEARSEDTQPIPTPSPLAANVAYTPPEVLSDYLIAEIYGPWAESLRVMSVSTLQELRASCYNKYQQLYRDVRWESELRHRLHLIDQELRRRGTR